jgi:hypothetical protein
VPKESRRRSFYRLAVLPGLPSVLGGCTDALSPPSVVPSSPRLTQEFVNWGEVLPVGSSASATYERTDLPSFAYFTVVELKVVGHILVQSLPGTSPTYYSGPIGANGLYQSGHGCYAQVLFSYSHPSGWYMNWVDNGCADQFSGPFKDSIRTVRAVRGNGLVRRNSLITYTNSCGWGLQCRSYSGSQWASVRVMPSDLRLAASKQTVVFNETVTFTAQADPANHEGVAVPVHVLSWQWFPLGGGANQTGQCAAGVNPCLRQIKESGTMLVNAIVQGIQRSEAIAVATSRRCSSPFLMGNPAVSDHYGSLGNDS